MNTTTLHELDSVFAEIIVKIVFFFNSQLNDTFKTVDEAVSAWNKIFE